MAVPRKPKPRTPDETKQINAAHARRKAFEKANPERFQGGMEPRPGTGYTTNMAENYRNMHVGVKHEPGDNIPGQQELPGMSHAATVNTPPRWEDLHPHERERITRNAAKFGVTHESAVRALGAQVDQGALREGRHSSFYSAEGLHPSGEMTPRTRLKESARENGVPFEQQAIANSITSPKQKFSRVPKSGPYAGNRVYPNDQNASAAVEAASQGRPDSARAVPGMGGLHGNSVRAAQAVSKMQGGASVSEAWQAGPKTGPYHNSWVDPHGPGQFWVSDIHSGGGGIAPHLTIPEREKYLSIGGIHSFNDHVARTVQKQRGIHSLTGMQSMQWNQERDLRAKQGHTEDTDSFMGRSFVAPQPAAIHGQMDLFTGGVHHSDPAPAPASHAEEFAPTLKDHMAAQAISANMSQKAYRESSAKRWAARAAGSHTAPDDDAWLKPATNNRY